jgi:predicted GNAT family N-acyltransferase
MEIIRVDNEAQLKQCFEVRIDVFVKEQKVPESLELDECDASPEACHHLLIRDAGKPIAAGRWRPYDSEGVKAKLQRIAVLAAYRGTGVGRLLMSSLEQWAMERGFTEGVLDAQVQAEPFYAKQGYVNISSEPFDDAGIPHVRMVKALTADE